MVAYSSSRVGQRRAPHAELTDGNVLGVWLDVDANVLEERDKAIWDFYAQSPDACSPTSWNDQFAGTIWSVIRRESWASA